MRHVMPVEATLSTCEQKIDCWTVTEQFVFQYITWKKGVTLFKFYFIFWSYLYNGYHVYELHEFGISYILRFQIVSPSTKCLVTFVYRILWQYCRLWLLTEAVCSKIKNKNKQAGGNCKLSGIQHSHSCA